MELRTERNGLSCLNFDRFQLFFFFLHAHAYRFPQIAHGRQSFYPLSGDERVRSTHHDDEEEEAEAVLWEKIDDKGKRERREESD